MAGLITSWTDTAITDSVLECVLSNRPDFRNVVGTSGSPTSAQIRQLANNYFGTFPDGMTIDDFLAKLNCTPAVPITPTTPAEPGLGSLLGGSTGKYLLFGVGGYLMLKMLKIIR